MVLHRAEEEEKRYLLVVKCENARMLYGILRSIQFRDKAIICASEKGLKVTVEDTKCVQASAFLQAELFSLYRLKEENVNFCINLRVLCECINIFGNPASGAGQPVVKMCYAGHGSPLKLLLEENGVVTDCAIKTLQPDDILDFEFALDSIVAKIIMKADPIRETFNDLDSSSECMEISVDPERGLQFSTTRTGCICETTILKDSEYFETFACTEKLTHQYRVGFLKAGAKALHLASKISIRIDHRGFFSIQYMIEQDSQIIFIEFFCAPQEETDDESQSVQV